MTADEKLIEIMAIGACEARLSARSWLRASDAERDIWRQEAEGSLSAIRAAGWFLIPPLDTEEGRDAVEKMLSTWFDDESVEIISAAISAAGGA